MTSVVRSAGRWWTRRTPSPAAAAPNVTGMPAVSTRPNGLSRGASVFLLTDGNRLGCRAGSAASGRGAEDVRDSAGDAPEVEVEALTVVRCRRKLQLRREHLVLRREPLQI